MQNAAAAAAAASAAASLPRFGPFHSILALRPTGWSHGQMSGGGSTSGSGVGAGVTSAGDSLPGDTLSYLEVLKQLHAHGGASESSWEREGDGVTSVTTAARPASGTDVNCDDADDLLLPSQVVPLLNAANGGGPSCNASLSTGRSNAALLRNLNEAAAAGAANVEDTRENRRARTIEATVVVGGSDDQLQQLGSASARGISVTSASSSSSAFPSLSSSSPSSMVRVRMMCQTRGGGAKAHSQQQHQQPAGGAPALAGQKRRFSTPDALSSSPASSSSSSSSLLPSGGVTLLSLPYSEHSSFSELREAVRTLNPQRIIPTVNCSSAQDAQRLVALLRAP